MTKEEIKAEIIKELALIELEDIDLLSANSSEQITQEIENKEFPKEYWYETFNSNYFTQLVASYNDASSPSTLPPPAESIKLIESLKREIEEKYAKIEEDNESIKTIKREIEGLQIFRRAGAKKARAAEFKKHEENIQRLQEEIKAKKAELKAAEDAARIAAEEAARIAADEAAKKTAEEAAKKAAEAEAKRIAAEKHRRQEILTKMKSVKGFTNNNLPSVNSGNFNTEINTLLKTDYNKKLARKFVDPIKQRIKNRQEYLNSVNYIGNKTIKQLQKILNSNDKAIYNKLTSFELKEAIDKFNSTNQKAKQSLIRQIIAKKIKMDKEKEAKGGSSNNNNNNNNSRMTADDMKLLKKLERDISNDPVIIEIIGELETKKHAVDRYYYKLWGQLKEAMKVYNAGRKVENAWLRGHVTKGVLDRIKRINGEKRVTNVIRKKKNKTNGNVKNNLNKKKTRRNSNKNNAKSVRELEGMDIEDNYLPAVEVNNDEDVEMVNENIEMENEDMEVRDEAMDELYEEESSDEDVDMYVD